MSVLNCLLSGWDSKEDQSLSIARFLERGCRERGSRPAMGRMWCLRARAAVADRRRRVGGGAGRHSWGMPSAIAPVIAAAWSVTCSPQTMTSMTTLL